MPEPEESPQDRPVASDSREAKPGSGPVGADVTVPSGAPASGSATVPHKEPPATQPAGPPDAVTGDSATSGGSPSPGGTSQQAEGGVPPGTTAPPPAAGIEQVPA